MPVILPVPLWPSLRLFRQHCLLIGRASHLLPHATFPWRCVGALIHFDCLDPFLFWNADGGKVFEPSAEIRKLIEQGALQSFRSVCWGWGGGRDCEVFKRSACNGTPSMDPCWTLALTLPATAATAPFFVFVFFHLSLETDTASSLILLPSDERRLRQLLLPVPATAPLRLLADRQWVQMHDDVSTGGRWG